MTIKNLSIANVSVVLTREENLVVKLELKEENGTTYTWIFDLEELVDVQRLKKIMRYVGASELKDLEGKTFRRVDIVNQNKLNQSQLVGFGHPTKDQFISIGTFEMMELTEYELRKMFEEES